MSRASAFMLERRSDNDQHAYRERVLRRAALRASTGTAFTPVARKYNVDRCHVQLCNAER